MKKMNLLLAVVGLATVLGIASCSSSSKDTATPSPAAYLTIIRYPWQISSIVFKQKDGFTDSLKYTSSDSLSTSRINFAYYTLYNNWAYKAADLNNSGWSGPKNDSTLFRYDQGVGVWAFDANWGSSVSAGNTNAAPDSLLFMPTTTNAVSVGPIVHCKINRLDSLHLQITYLDSSILNKSTNTKYQIMKVVTLGAVTQ